MNRIFSVAGLAVIGACAVVDAAALLALAFGPEMARECGSYSILGGLFLGAVFTFGLVPLVIALLGIGASKLFRQLRSPWIWLTSALLLSGIAWGAVSAAGLRGHPINPASCTL